MVVRPASVPPDPASDERVPERTIAAHELFFSTTDRRGVIRSGNSVFVRISGYTAGELIGSPHSMVRHPAMPGAVFHLLWQRLMSGRPMAAYIVNRAKDGAPYWVFATVTPIADGFLSVRVAPRGPLLEPISRLYEEIRRFEADARRSGMTKAQAAEAGAQELTRRLREYGYSGYDEVVDDALPVEVAARGDLLHGRLSRPGAVGTAGEVLAATLALGEQLSDLVRRLDRYGQLAGALENTSRSILRAADLLSEAVAAARAAGERVASSTRVLASVAGVTDQLAQRTVALLEDLVRDLRATRSQVSQLRFRVALAALHNDMAATFGAEVADGEAPTSAMGDVALLCDALLNSVDTMAVTLPEVNARLAGVSDRADEAVENFRQVRKFTAQWRALVYRRGQAAAVSDDIEPVDRHLSESHEQLAEFARIGHACRDEIAPFDVTALENLLTRVQAAARSATTAQPPSWR